MKKLIAMLMALSMVLSLAACGGKNNTPTDDTKELKGPQTELIYDTQGNAFEIPMDLQRVIVMNSRIYEMIYVLGKDDIVIGVSDTTKPLGSAAKDTYGDWREPNVEKILEAAPDAVFGYASWLDSGLAKQITDAGIPVVMLDLYVPSNILNEVEFLGKLLGAEERAAAFSADVQEILDLVVERTADVEPITAYWEGYTDYKSVGKGSGGDELMQLANVASLTGNEETSYPKISDEWIVEQNPQMIIKMISDTKGIMDETISDYGPVQQVYADMCARPGWDGLDAVKDGKVLFLSAQIGTSPLGLGLGPLFIAKAAYPEKFEDVDPNAYLSDMLETYWGMEMTGIWSYQD